MALNLALISGPQDVPGLLAQFNALILNLNASRVGAINVQSSAAGVGNGADTTDDTLFSYILAAGYFSATNPVAGLRITAWGTSAANGNNKQFKLFFGTLAVIASGVVTINNKSWWASGDVLRTGVSTQQACGRAISDAAVIATSVQAGAITETAAITIKVTGASGTSGVASDLLGFGFTIEQIS